MPTIVLVPGACLGGWAWERVALLLEAAGHDVRPVTLTGMERPPGDASGVGVGTHVADLVGLLEHEDLRDVVLVAHSYAGMPATGAAATEAGAARIARLVALDAALPDGERSLFAAGPPEFEAEIMGAVAAGGDPHRVPFFTDEQLDAYFPGNELTAEDRAWMRAHGVGQPLGTFREGLLEGAAERAARVPRTYVTCTRRMGPSPVGDETPGWEHATLESGHWPMVARPRETAELLDRIARRTAAAPAR